MALSTEWLALAIAMLGVASSGLIALLVYRSSRQQSHANLQREIGNLYDKVTTFRETHIEVMVLSRHWTDSCFEAIYRQESSEDKAWALYYAYVELCIGFVNSVLYGRHIGLLDEPAVNNQFKHLINLILTENYPFVASAAKGVYLSPFVRGSWLSRKPGDGIGENVIGALARATNGRGVPRKIRALSIRLLIVYCRVM